MHCQVNDYIVPLFVNNMLLKIFRSCASIIFNRVTDGGSLQKVTLSRCKPGQENLREIQFNNMSAVIPSGKSSKDLQTQRIFVEQLRRELTVQRVKLSICVNELIQYCEQQGNVDPLVSPKAAHDNPFRNSGGKCVLF